MNHYLTVKMGVDKLAALLLLLLIWPLILVCGILIKIEDSTGPIFFLQERVGRKNKKFKIYKLRSMRAEKDSNGNPLTERERLLTIGLIIRKLSLDEMPQLINILRGEMSFIGPRPLLVNYLPCYTKKEIQRHNVNPGISGWAQVNGRNSLNWEERFALDIEYIEKISFSFDFKILFLTIVKVIKRSDISENEEENLEDFDNYRVNQWQVEELPKAMVNIYGNSVIIHALNQLKQERANE